MTAKDLQQWVENKADDVGGIHDFCAQTDVTLNKALHWSRGNGLESTAEFMTAVEKLGYKVKFVKEKHGE